MDSLCRKRIRELLVLKDSTTLYFERLTGMVVSVTVQNQVERENKGDMYLFRESLLFLDNPDFPIAYCLCEISESMLQAYEIEQLKSGKVPLGKVLGIDEHPELTKGNITINTSYDESLSEKMLTKPAKCYIKQYDLFYSNKFICNIKEIVNEESFSRLLKA